MVFDFLIRTHENKLFLLFPEAFYRPPVNLNGAPFGSTGCITKKRWRNGANYRGVNSMPASYFHALSTSSALRLVAVAAVFMAASPALAQEAATPGTDTTQAEEGGAIIVTAQRRAEKSAGCPRFIDGRDLRNARIAKPERDRRSDHCCTEPPDGFGQSVRYSRRGHSRFFRYA